ncbi:MAG: purine-nucleoside phosphorylase [Kiritimatiellaeota bacterium]|nr:purine-nucleoside phosphorylase [Kiritimatiellota bacterium]
MRRSPHDDKQPRAPTSGRAGSPALADVRDTLAYGDVPGLGGAAVHGHAGQVLWAECGGVETLVFQGRRHYYEGDGWTPVALPVFLLRQLGAELLVLTNAAGGLHADLDASDLMIITDHLNLMGDHPLIGPHDPAWGPRFPDMSQVYCPKLGQRLGRIFEALHLPVRRGVYAAVTGPTYETPAEVRLLRSLGADAVGMSTVPEALLARAAGLRVAGLSCIANRAAGLQPQALTHADVLQAARAMLPKLRAVLEHFWKELPHELGPTHPAA